jgi:hypothetical protein
MSYRRKQEDVKRYKQLRANMSRGYPQPVWYAYWRTNPHWVRYTKSQGKKSCYAWAKRYARKKARLHMKRTDVYTNKVADPCYIAW